MSFRKKQLIFQGYEQEQKQAWMRVKLRTVSIVQFAYGKFDLFLSEPERG